MLIDRRLVEPEDDLTTRLLNIDYEGRQLTREEILDILFLQMAAGLDTVTASLDCIIVQLAQDATRRDELSTSPERIPVFMEQLLRLETPVSLVLRYATEDVTLHDYTIAAGTQVMLVLGAANTDDRKFDAAEEMLLGRAANPHLAFGAGPHRCLGAHPARLELQVAFEELHRVVPSYRLATGTSLQYSVGIRQVVELPLVWELSRRGRS